MRSRRGFVHVPHTQRTTSFDRSATMELTDMDHEPDLFAVPSSLGGHRHDLEEPPSPTETTFDHAHPTKRPKTIRTRLENFDNILEIEMKPSHLAIRAEKKEHPPAPPNEPH